MEPRHFFPGLWEGHPDRRPGLAIGMLSRNGPAARGDADRTVSGEAKGWRGKSSTDRRAKARKPAYLTGGTGSLMVNSVPACKALVTAMVPPWLSMIDLAMDKPSPAWPLERDPSTW